MNAGMLNKKVVVQKITISTGEIGEEIETWVDYYNSFAYINGLSGSEYWQASAQQAENTVVFTMRYSKLLANVTPQSYRIIFDNKIFDINSIDNVQYQNRTIKIKAVAKIE